MLDLHKFKTVKIQHSHSKTPATDHLKLNTEKVAVYFYIWGKPKAPLPFLREVYIYLFNGIVA